MPLLQSVTNGFSTGTPPVCVRLKIDLWSLESRGSLPPWHKLRIPLTRRSDLGARFDRNGFAVQSLLLINRPLFPHGAHAEVWYQVCE